MERGTIGVGIALLILEISAPGSFEIKVYDHAPSNLRVDDETGKGAELGEATFVSKTL
jgi:hypothetical protein